MIRLLAVADCPRMQKTYAPFSRGLRRSGERPRGRDGADRRDKFAPLH